MFGDDADLVGHPAEESMQTLSGPPVLPRTYGDEITCFHTPLALAYSSTLLRQQIPLVSW